jgi:hypothetical protein
MNSTRPGSISAEDAGEMVSSGDSVLRSARVLEGDGALPGTAITSTTAAAAKAARTGNQRRR